MIHIPRIV